MERYLYVGCSRYGAGGYKSLYKLLASDGSTVWSVDTVNDVYGVVADSSGVYVAESRAWSNYTTRKYTLDGSIVWSKDHGDSCFKVIVHPNETQIITAGYEVTGGEARTYDKSDGTNTVLQTPIAIATRGLALYNDSGTVYYYFAGDYVGSINVCKMQDTSTIWSDDLHGASGLYDIAVDSAENIYVVGGVSGSVTTRKYNSARSSQWTDNHGATVYCICVDSSGNVYTGGEVSSSVTTRKYNSSGTRQLGLNHTATVRGICVDSGGNIYTAGEASGSGSYTVRKYNSSGTLQWSKPLQGSGSAARAIFVVDEIPSAPLQATPAATATATGRLHTQPLLGFPPSRLAAEMLLDDPELFAPCSEIAMPTVNQRYSFIDQELIDYSGNGHEILLNGSSGFVAGSTANARYPVPRVNYHGISTATWSGYSSPSIKTDVGPSLWDITQAWAVECWTRRYGNTASQYHWYFGNNDVYSPVLHHVYLGQGWFEVAGSKHKRVLYSITGDAEYKWHQLVLNYDGSGTITLYVDAVSVATLSQSIAALGVTLHNSARLYWGQNQSGGSQYPPTLSSFTYAYLALYRHALSAERIAAHYRAGVSAADPVLKPFFAPILQPHWTISGSH